MQHTVICMLFMSAQKTCCALSKFAPSQNRVLAYIACNTHRIHIHIAYIYRHGASQPAQPFPPEDADLSESKCMVEVCDRSVGRCSKTVKVKVRTYKNVHIYISSGWQRGIADHVNIQKKGILLWRTSLCVYPLNS
jgi:hypothetical protein